MRLVSETVAILIAVSAAVVVTIIASAVLGGVVSISKPKGKDFTVYRVVVDVAPAPYPYASNHVAVHATVIAFVTTNNMSMVDAYIAIPSEPGRYMLVPADTIRPHVLTKGINEIFLTFILDRTQVQKGMSTEIVVVVETPSEQQIREVVPITI